jgi:hypothetical protein
MTYLTNLHDESSDPHMQSVQIMHNRSTQLFPNQRLPGTHIPRFYYNTIFSVNRPP